MLHRLILSTIGLLTLAMCKNQNISKNSDSSTKTEVSTDSSTKTTPVINKKSDVPEMSDGLPPDKEAAKIAKEEQANASKKNSEIIYFKEGENKFLKEYEMNVTFKKMTEDSRCPTDVNCVWEGVATAEIELMGLATRPYMIKLSTINNTSRNYKKTQTFNGYSISLVELSPQTTSDKGFKALQGSYKIGLRFEKGNYNEETTTK